MNDIIGFVMALIFFISIIFLIFVILSLLDMIEKYYRIKKFEEDYKLALIHSQISWEDVKNICNTRGLKSKEVIYRIKNIHSEILIGREEKLNNFKDLISSHIKNYENDEPFDNLPNNIKFNLEKIKEKLNHNALMLEPLTKEILQILKELDKNNLKQKIFNWMSLIIGISGLLLAIFTTFIQPEFYSNKTNMENSNSIENKN